MIQSKTLKPDMTTHSGEPMWFQEPEKTKINYNDIKFAIKRLARYNCQYDVLLYQHLYLCGRLSEHYYPGEILTKAYCVSHDLHETYIGDLPTGLKKYLPDFQYIEQLWELHVHEQIGIPLYHCPHEKVKFIDRRALALEMYYIGHPGARDVMAATGGRLKDTEEGYIRSSIWDSFSDQWYYIKNSIDQGAQLLKQETENGIQSKC